MKSSLLVNNRMYKTVPTCGDIARFYLALGLGFGFIGWNVVGLKYGGEPLFFWPGVGLLLASFVLVSYWATEKLIQFMNYIGRNSVAYRLEQEHYSTQAPEHWSTILGPDAQEKRRKEAEARKLRAIGSPDADDVMDRR